MPKVIQLFKGGFSTHDKNGVKRDDRIAINQRPADGHLKSGSWEDHIRVNKNRFKCNPADLEVGDVIGLHTTLTFGIVEALGISIIEPEEGLKFKIVVSDPTVSLANLDFAVYEFDNTEKKFKAISQGQTVDNLEEIGDKELYYAGYHKPGADLIRITNAVQIGLEVVALPPGGLKRTFDFESRLHMRQVVRPPACMECC